MANKLRPEPMPSATNALLGAIGQFYENDGLAGLLGMTSVNRQIHDATQAQLAAPDIRSGVAAAVDNPMTMAVGPATIRAYHGSPYSFDKFDLSKIGTGEGAQAYGHGLYFADNEAVAKAYRDDLGGVGYFVNGEHVGTNGALGKNWRGLAASHLADAEGDANAALAKVAASAERRNAGGYGYYPDEAAAVGREIEKMRGLPVEWRPMGSMYEVNLHADPAALLDWDKPLAQQSPQVRQGVVQSGLFPGATAEDLATFTDPGQFAYKRGIAERLGGPLLPGRSLSEPASQVSQALNQSGIPGIKYLDGGSRGAGTGTSNYVMFDPARVEILRKYGLLPAAAVGAGAATSSADAALTPVDHDPFGAPLVPVDHDPFGGQ